MILLKSLTRGVSILGEIGWHLFYKFSKADNLYTTCNMRLVMTAIRLHKFFLFMFG